MVSFTAQLEAQSRPFFCLGTVVHNDEDKEPTQGRLLVFSAYASPVPKQNSTVELSLLASAEVNGCVYALKMVKGKIIAAINSSVREYPLAFAMILFLRISDSIIRFRRFLRRDTFSDVLPQEAR